MHVTCQLHDQAALLPGKEPPVPRRRADLDVKAWRKKNPCPSQESNSDHLARSLVTILTELFKIKCIEFVCNACICDLISCIS
jgi:hypothetical protein